MSIIEQALKEGRSTLSDEETRSLVASEIARLFGLTIEAFGAAVEAGEVKDHPAVPPLALLIGARLPTC